MDEHKLFLLLAELAIVVVAARLGGEVAVRLHVPEVVGEILAGICLGPSLLGALWPNGFHALFPTDPEQYHLLELMGWIGVVFLVLLSGWEINLGLLRHARKAVATAWIGGFFLPFALGYGLGWLVPGELLVPGISRAVFALFIGTAMSISAIPVVARILLDLDLIRTRVGMVIMSTAMADDTAGWIVLAIVTGLATTGGFQGHTVAIALGGIVVFLVFAFTIGTRLVHLAMLGSARLRMPFAQTTVVLAIVLAGGAITQAIHVHLVLGAFIASVLVAQSPGRNPATRDAIRHVALALFVPFFFGYTGVKVDLTTLTGAALPVAIAAIVVASFGKLVGGGLGARLGGLTWPESIAVGAGLNARGAMELVIAAIGLSIGVLTVPMFSIVVMIAVVTTFTAAPMLRRYAIRHAAQLAVPAPEDMDVPA